MIIFPIIFFLGIAFVFQSSISDIKFQTLRLNCPFPVVHGNVTNVNFNADGTNVTFSAEYSNKAFANDVTKFNCIKTQAGQLQISTTFYNSTESFFPSFDFTFAEIGWLQMTFDRLFDRGAALVTVIYLLVNAPAQLSGLVFFTYINIFLITLIAFGVFLAARGS